MMLCVHDPDSRALLMGVVRSFSGEVNGGVGREARGFCCGS